MSKLVMFDVVCNLISITWMKEFCGARFEGGEQEREKERSVHTRDCDSSRIIGAASDAPSTQSNNLSPKSSSP